MDQLLCSLSEDNKWKNISIDDIVEALDSSDKKRHEINDGKIRALYGHSIPQKIVKIAKEPPEILYHGTVRRFVDAIMAEGLLPKGRQQVHLSSDTGTTSQVGKRRDGRPILPKIHAKRAWDEGVEFYHGNETIWLADGIDSKYIEI